MENLYDISDIRARLNPVFDASGVKSAVLYGSYAKGAADAKSDVDLLVDSGLHGLDFVAAEIALPGVAERTVPGSSTADKSGTVVGGGTVTTENGATKPGAWREMSAKRPLL